MSYWTDDRALGLEQRKLDAIQASAKERMEAKPSKTCMGERCWCGAPAAKKVGEEIPFDDPNPNRHNLTSYICAEHYAQLMGPLGAKQVGL